MVLELINVTHLTSAHSRYDVRIFAKMCSSLAQLEDYKVSLVVADGKGGELKNSISIIDVGAKTGSRISRMTKTVKKIFKKAKELDSDIYHLHDPELLPVGLKLKKLRKKVIFDSHEDVEKDILSKEWIALSYRKIISKSYFLYEKFVCKKLDYIVTATPYIRNKFLKINPNSMDVNNFPVIGELSSETYWSEKKDEICYVGGITKIRGIKEVIQAMEYTDDISLNLVGAFSEKKFEVEIKKHKGWVKVNELGFLTRDKVTEILGRSKIGLVTFYPVPNHIDAQPNKMFEYMSAGIPIITSDFPLWKEIVEGNKCGICINPLNPQEIAAAMKYIINNPIEAEQMGENGKLAILERYNWGVEKQKLYKVYRDIMNA